MSHGIREHFMVRLVVLATVASTVTCAAFAQGYAVTELPGLGGNFTEAFGLNDLGDAAGLSRHAGQTYWDAVLWPDSGGFIDLGLMGGMSNQANDVNNAGRVVGSVFTQAGSFTAWIWESGTATPIFTDGGANAVNELGEVAGFRAGPVLWLPAPNYGLPAGVNPLASGGWHDGSAVGLNNRGQVVGQSVTSTGLVRPFLWLPAPAYGLPAGMNNLGVLGAGPLHAALDLNDLGQAVGWSDVDTSVRRPFLWLPAPAYGLPAGIHNLGTLGGSSLGQNNWANAISASGLVVGQAETAAGQMHAFVWQDRVMTDLNDRIPAGSGWELVEATDINTSGQIVGYGMLDGQTRAFRLTPRPLGDLNCDGFVNAFDIDPFVLALTDPDGYEAAYPNCDRMLGDCNCDGVVNAFDIDPFVQCLTSGCPPC